MMNFSVYKLQCIVTGQIYFGLTGREVDTRINEHFTQYRHKNTRLSNLIEKNPNIDDWEVSTLYRTPIYPEAFEIEAAFINLFNERYPDEILNIDIRPCKNKLALEWVRNYFEGFPPIMLYDYQPHPDYQDVFLYRDLHVEFDKVWFYGYRGRGSTDSDAIWVTHDTDETDLEKAIRVVSMRMDDVEIMGADMLPDSFGPMDPTDNRQTPLQSLVTIGNILTNTRFDTQDEIEQFFTVVNGMKATL